MGFLRRDLTIAARDRGLGAALGLTLAVQLVVGLGILAGAAGSGTPPDPASPEMRRLLGVLGAVTALAAPWIIVRLELREPAERRAREVARAAASPRTAVASRLGVGYLLLSVLLAMPLPILVLGAQITGASALSLARGVLALALMLASLPPALHFAGRPRRGALATLATGYGVAVAVAAGSAAAWSHLGASTAPSLLVLAAAGLTALALAAPSVDPDAAR